DTALLTLLPYVRHVKPDFVDHLLNATRRIPLTAPHDESLSEREREVLRLLAAGLSNGEIAVRLVISPGTVKRHINHIYAKLSVTSRTQAMLKARELGLD
ncbi:MAG: response regulator transcription factor, partial [Anaerolineae bacterium]|nr:response regulator transcription factor [Anaerolineae bacterium]